MVERKHPQTAGTPIFQHLPKSEKSSVASSKPVATMKPEPSASPSEQSSEINCSNDGYAFVDPRGFDHDMKILSRTKAHKSQR